MNAPFAPGPDRLPPAASPRRSRPALWIVGGLIALAAFVAVVLVITGRDHGPTVAAAATAAAPTYSVSSFPPAPSMPATEATSAPAWTPCGDDCADLYDDACDGAYDASRESKGSLMDVLIENKDEIDADRLKDCPQFLDEWKIAKGGFGEGSQEVGVDVKPGTYETTAHLSEGRVSECYWERSGTNGRTIANDLVTAAKKVRVTIRKGDEMFTSERCGDWMPVS